MPPARNTTNIGQLSRSTLLALTLSSIGNTAAGRLATVAFYMITHSPKKKVAILAADGFEQAELESPLEALRSAGYTVSIVSVHGGSIQGMHHMDKGDSFPVNVTLDHADPQNYSALVIPGGLYNPDTLRSTPTAIDFVRAFDEAHKPIAAICHGPWLLAEAHLLEGRRVTSWPAIQSDLRNAGADWVDEEVVVDRGLVTSRNPDDLPAFNRKMLEEFEAA